LKFHNIYFEYGSAELNARSKIILDKVILMLKENKGIQIELSAHTDSRADASFNIELSKKRAESAKIYIISNNINSEQIISKGYYFLDVLQLKNHLQKSSMVSFYF